MSRELVFQFIEKQLEALYEKSNHEMSMDIKEYEATRAHIEDLERIKELYDLANKVSIYLQAFEYAKNNHELQILRFTNKKVTFVKILRDHLGFIDNDGINYKLSLREAVEIYDKM
jgi:hypothetical protein